ncbi:glycosyltransferase [Mesotoga sp. B105.6.4]|uniref:glycosyltransferase n=1 Tax=Mesotoga sp. B105.6.4 TaxID=1582224 RepID=UPI001CA5F166|nr:glycosyltransferase [Mesotoga sp. B105.6.4]
MTKTVLSINTSNRGSTGRIMTQITNLARETGYDAYMAYGRGDEPSDEKSIKIGTKLDIYWHGLVTRVTGKHGFSSKKAAKSFLEKVDEIEPNLIHLHNIHGYYTNIELLFRYIKAKRIPVIWTLHDCWAFTGHCAYFDYVGCNKWKTGCYKCPQVDTYPRSLFFDHSEKSYWKKKELFENVENMILVTPSKWLKNLVEESFLRHHQTIVINNGVDTEAFSPRASKKSSFGISEDKFVILGVAAQFSPRKGLKYFLEIADKLDESSVIFLIGLNKKQIRSLPKNITGIQRTENIERLVEAYSMADVFVNPTLEDNFPTTNLEALACGAPVITFRTGGSPETIDNTCGLIVDKGDTGGLFNAIEIVKKRGKEEYTKNCRKRAIKRFDSGDRFREYVELYGRLLTKYFN